MTRAEIRETTVAFGFGAVVEEFFDRLAQGMLVEQPTTGPAE
ncbi:MAG TPA: hypothetical protein VIE89_34545 [Candidatus Binatia bacterium]|jgi:hypothetical protein